VQIADSGWRALIDATVEGMIVIDARGAIEAFNRSAERMFGYQAADVMGDNVSMLMPSPDRDLHDQYVARYRLTGVGKVIGSGRDVTGLRRNGTQFPVHLSDGEMRVADEPHFVGIVHDLSARTKLEERIREQAFLARLGEMAAVLAHEVRNPLAAVRGAIQVLGKRFPAGGHDANVVRQVLARLDGLNELVQDLLLLGRAPTPRREPVELRHVLGGTRDLLAAHPLFQGVRVEMFGSAPPIAVDGELLKIAFHNLMLNAAQALEGRGTIRASISVIDDRQVVVIADSGPGMSAETRAHLFQPFFTTKTHGTGLGLAIVRRLVESHDGTVNVDCPSGGGTVITIAFPTTLDSSSSR
jgi:two-component system sensor kinase FixL